MSDIWIPDSPSQLRFIPDPVDFVRGILPELFAIIINEPSSITFTSDKHQPEKLLELHQTKKQQQKRLRNKAWQFIAQYSLPQFIWMIREFPNPLLSHVKPLNRNEEDVILVLRYAYQNITQWLFDLTKCEKRFLWWKPSENYKPWAEIFVAQLTLAKAVYDHKQSQGLRQLFTSPEHLWFWCQVAMCKQNLKVMGLESPIPHTQIISKQDFLERWNRTNKMRKNFEEALDKGVISPTRSEWFENLNWFLEGEAMRIAQVEASWNKKGGVWLEYTNAQKQARDQVRHEKDLQCVFLYQFPNDKESRIHITGLHQKLPKPPKKKKRGFNPKR
jgi:hypothetical protein